MEAQKMCDEHISLIVTGQGGSVMHFKIRKNTPLLKLMLGYCDRTGMKMGSTRFRFDGQPINKKDTPSKLNMADGDAIDASQLAMADGGATDASQLDTADGGAMDVFQEHDEHMNLKVTRQDGSVLHFKIKNSTRLRKLMSAYCERTGVDIGSTRFHFDGLPINEMKTPSQLNMADGDAIDVFEVYDEHMNLKVTGEDGSEVNFKIKKNTPLCKLMSAYCGRMGVERGSTRFHFDGQPINETNTPSQLNMVDGDAIDAFQEMPLM